MTTQRRFSWGYLWMGISVTIALALAVALPFFGFNAAQSSPQLKSAASTVHCEELGGPTGLPDWFNFNLRFGIDVTFVNETQWPLKVKSSQIDCFDFSGDQNPSLLDGLSVAAGSSSSATRLIARRVCPWIDGDIIGKFQERDAHWATTASLGTVGTFDIPTVLYCSSRRHTGTMCTSGYAQDYDSFLKHIGLHLYRITLGCADNSVTITVKTEV
jgi:hypothetical protein